MGGFETHGRAGGTTRRFLQGHGCQNHHLEFSSSVAVPPLLGCDFENGEAGGRVARRHDLHMPRCGTLWDLARK
jgi:hypothetical protein